MSAQVKFDLADLDKLLGGIKIPPQPQVLKDLRDEQEKGFPNLQRVGQLISKDIGLSASALKAINSPFYGQNQKINSIQQAVMLLGADNIINIVTATGLSESVRGRASISLDRFWMRATDIANICMSVARHMHISKVDDYYALGLFHDAGIAVLARKYENYKEVQALANSNDLLDLAGAEEQAYQTNHATIGYYLARSWYLPETICEVIRDHHELKQMFLQGFDNSERNEMMAILQLANNIFYSFERGNNEPNWFKIVDLVLDQLALSESDYRDLEMDLHEMLQKS